VFIMRRRDANEKTMSQQATGGRIPCSAFAA
jgi:hypothetical protein